MLDVIGEGLDSNLKQIVDNCRLGFSKLCIRDKAMYNISHTASIIDLSGTKSIRINDPE
jgi:hypothetical protein